MFDYILTNPVDDNMLKSVLKTKGDVMSEVVRPDFDTDWAHSRKIPNDFNGLTWIFRQMPRYMDC